MEVCAVQPPGWETRLHQVPLTDLLANKCTQTVAEKDKMRRQTQTKNLSQCPDTFVEWMDVGEEAESGRTGVIRASRRLCFHLRKGC